MSVGNKDLSYHVQNLLNSAYASIYAKYEMKTFHQRNLHVILCVLESR